MSATTEQGAVTARGSFQGSSHAGATTPDLALEAAGRLGCAIGWLLVLRGCDA